MDSLFHLHQPGFSRFVSASFVLHIIILAVALLLVTGSQKKIFITPTYTKVNLIAPPVKKKVAVKKTKVKKVVKAPVKKTVALKKEVTPKPVEVKEKVSVEDAISRLEKEVAEEEEDLLIASRIDELLKKTEEEDKEKQELMEALRAEIAEYEDANKSVSAATSANIHEGVSSELFDLKFKSYYNKVGAKIQSLWNYPGSADKELETVITIEINRGGALMDYWIEKRSKSKFFDDSALRAIEKAAPFPPLPEEYNEESIEIGFRFCPGGCEQNN